MRIATLLLPVFFCFFSCESQNLNLFVGTYTSGESEGIYRITFNQETGVFGEYQLAAKCENPSFLAWGPDKKYLYAIKELNTYQGTNSGAVVAYANTSNTLEFQNELSSHGAHACHIAIDSKGEFVAVSNYSGGTLTLYQLINGKLGSKIQVFNHNTPEIKSHVHSAKFSDDYLFVADLGRNSIFQYKRKGAAFELVTSSLIPFEENAGPRHFDMSSDKNYIYIINEYANSITSALLTDGKAKLLNSTSTLSENTTGESFSADIHISSDQRFIYGSNRGENSIAVFSRNQKDGAITKIQNIGVEGDWPRNFTLSPNGKFLLVGNQKSNNISVFSVDKTNGNLSFQHSIDFPSPVCLLF